MRYYASWCVIIFVVLFCLRSNLALLRSSGKMSREKRRTSCHSAAQANTFMIAIIYLWPLLISWIMQSSGIVHEPTRCGTGPAAVFLGFLVFGVVAIGCVTFFLILTIYVAVHLRFRQHSN